MARTRRGAGTAASHKRGSRTSAKGGKGGRPRQGTGRVTPKGGTPGGPVATGRYTPPVPKTQKVSPRWVPVLMFTLLISGVVVITANYMALMPGDTSNLYLVMGLVLITAGFVTATRYR